MKILVTSTSFASVQGKHIDLLESMRFELTYAQGPIIAERLIDIIGDFDGIIAGDDEYTSAVLERGKQGRLKAIAKYGNGLDSFDLVTAKDLGILVQNCGGGNGSTVAEHVFALLLSHLKNIVNNSIDSRNGKWNRPINTSLKGKKIGVIGAGSVGIRVIELAQSFGCEVFYYDLNELDKEINYAVRCNTLKDIFMVSDIISLHLPLNTNTKQLINARLFNYSQNLILINTARGGIVNEEDLVAALNSNKVQVYLTDVLHKEPLDSSSIIFGRKDVVITSHCGSRTVENIEEQGIEAVQNLKRMLLNEK